MNNEVSVSSPGRWFLCKRLGLAVLLIALTYLSMCLAYLRHQDRALFPGRVTQGQPDRIVPPSPEYELVHFTTTHGDAIAAIFGRALDAQDHIRPDAAARPTILFFTGNASTMSGDMNEFRDFRRLGCNVMIPDYPGYGMSGGRASERALYACADAAYEYLCHRTDVDPAQIVSAGWSLGAAVATDLAAHRPVMGLMVLSAFTSWKDEINEHAYWLPASIWLRAGFDSEAKFKKLRCPLFIAHGRADGIIPFYMSQRLAAARGRVVPLELDTGHEVLRSRSDKVMSAIGRFIEESKTPPSP